MLSWGNESTEEPQPPEFGPYSDAFPQVLHWQGSHLSLAGNLVSLGKAELHLTQPSQETLLCLRDKIIWIRKRGVRSSLTRIPLAHLVANHWHNSSTYEIFAEVGGGNSIQANPKPTFSFWLKSFLTIVKVLDHFLKF